MDRAFLDANVLFSAAYKRNAKMQELWKLKNVELLTSSYALGEARRNLAKRGQRIRLGLLMRAVRLVEEASQQQLPLSMTLPDKDVPIFCAAAAAQATHLVTGDLRHFGPYYGKIVAGVLIVSPSEYVKRRAQDAQ